MRKTRIQTFFDVSCLVVCRDSSKRAVFKSFKPEYLCSVVLLVKIYIGEKKKEVKDYKLPAPAVRNSGKLAWAFRQLLRPSAEEKHKHEQ